ncbi:hypothetical protein [Methanobrevibacter woesei]|uniref:hypothetical protein n=1 Tax=Methanobrevibacter woesei TaxID=190976 RepID=UPI0039F597BD
MEWNPLQAKVNSINLNDLLNEDFLKKVKKEFADKKVDLINLQLVIMDEKINDGDNPIKDIITLSNRDINDTLFDTIIVDVNSEENYDKIKNVLTDL